MAAVLMLGIHHYGSACRELPSVFTRFAATGIKGFANDVSCFARFTGRSASRDFRVGETLFTLSGYWRPGFIHD
jgi:hypothetical protein